LPTAQWLKIIDDIAQHGGESVVFTGGEPLLREDSVQLMRHARERGLQVNLLTNGLRVKKLLPALTEAVSFVQVSLNGPDEASNDAIRGPGTFRRVIDALDALLEAGIPTRVGMTVMDMNWQAVRVGFLAFAEGYAGTPLRFHLGYGLCHFGRAEGLEDNFDLEDARPLLDSYLASVNHWEGRRITRKTTGCGYCEQLVVAPNGVVYPCHLLDGPLGLIDDRPLSAWHTTLRALALDHSVDRVEGCHSCYLRYLCGGTCRVINEKRTGSRLVTTCSEAERTARNRSLVRLFGPSAAYPARARPVQAG
jgi:radical SAM protein with 4Fe4S-binding SPASM domain